MPSSEAFLNPEDDQIQAMLASMKRVAVVGISAKEDRASHGIARWLVGRGLEVVGVNPALKEPVLGLEIYPSLEDVPGPVDMVDIFRRGDTIGPVIEAAITRQDRGVWLQEQVINPEAAAQARAAGLFSIMDRCIYKEWLRLMNG